MGNEGKFSWMMFIKGILFLFAGLFFIVKPETAVTQVSFYIGLTLIILSIVTLWYAYQRQKTTVVGPLQFLGPVVALVAGLILLFLPEFALSVFSISLGIWILLDGIIYIRVSAEMKHSGMNMGFILVLMGIVSLLIGSFIILRPMEFVKLLTVFFGLAMFLSGGFMLRMSFPRGQNS